MAVTVTTDNIKLWLKRRNSDRDWLGDQLGVTKRTVDNWLSAGRDIPEAKLSLIERLMADDDAESARQKQLSAPQNQIFSIEVSLARFRRYDAAAKNAGQMLEQWTIATLDAEVEHLSTTGGTLSLPLPHREQLATQRDEADIALVREAPAEYSTEPSPTPRKGARPLNSIELAEDTRLRATLSASDYALHTAQRAAAVAERPGSASRGA